MAQPVATDGWQLVAGDDDVPERNRRLRERHLVWQQMVAARSTRSFQDAEFPAGPRAVDGRREDRVGTDVFRATLSEVSHRAGVPEEGVLCRCGQPAQLRRVQRKGPTFGRPYYACPLRSCRFFEFADQASTVAALELQWKRFPAVGDWCVVHDEGFRPADVQQGGVGDCWFMSALAVVAERHDLMSKLLPNLNIGAESGCHEVRLFLDGRWTSLLVDDHLPTTTKQRRPTADGSGLAFGRCARRQLWVSLIEASAVLRSPPWHRHIRRRRSLARQRVRAALSRGTVPRSRDVLLLNLHHSRPAYPMGGGRKKQWSQAEWQEWQQGGRQGGQSGGRSSRLWSGAWASASPLARGAERGAERYDRMPVRPAQSSTAAPKTENAVTGADSELNRELQRSLTVAKKADIKIRKLQEEKERRAAQWDAFVLESRKKFLQQRKQYAQDIERINADMLAPTETGQDACFASYFIDLLCDDVLPRNDGPRHALVDPLVLPLVWCPRPAGLPGLLSGASLDLGSRILGIAPGGGWRTYPFAFFLPPAWILKGLTSSSRRLLLRAPPFGPSPLVPCAPLAATCAGLRLAWDGLLPCSRWPPVAGAVTLPLVFREVLLLCLGTGSLRQHAYSVLETDESAFQTASQAGYGFALLERRVKVRNPWGEWTRREQDELLAQLGAAVVPDEGSFWMSLGFKLL
ncbi:CAPN15 [Symbiodinium sp. CCMP2456]|nr:CAPN15 [Symbiodinium sp. CCMP2456]